MSLNSPVYFITALVLCLLLSMPVYLNGQVLEPSSSELSPPGIYWSQVETVVEIGLRDNPEILGFRVMESVSLARFSQTRLFPNPVFGFEWERKRGGTDGERRLSIEIPLPVDGRREAAMGTAKASTDEVRHEIADRERLLRQRIRDSVTTVVAERMKYALLLESLRLAERNQALVAESVEQGLRAPLELNKESVFVNGIRARLEIAQADVSEAESFLATLLGRDSLVGIDLPTSLPGVGYENQKLTGNAEEFLGRRPDVLASQARNQMAEGLLREARAEGRPTFELMFGITEMKSGFPLRGLNSNGEFFPIEDRMRFAGVGLKIGIPIFNRNQGNISAAAGSVESSRLMTSFVERQARNELGVATTRVSRSNRSLELMSKGVIDQARDNFRVMGLSYQEGAISLDEFLRERRTLIDLELEFIESAQMNAIAESALMASTGVMARCEITATCKSGGDK